jgi:hypothetical protein
LASDLLSKSDGSPFGVPVLFKLPASELAGKDGPFLAVLTVKPKDGKTAASASAAFEIAPAPLH